jgi:hypothetical protein
MNKELIKKYKEEFEYWLDGGELLFRVNDRWNLHKPDSDEFIYDYYNGHKCTSIIINDEYVELRKNISNGKQIQYYGTSINGGYGESWNDCSEENLFIYDVKQYRIKQDEHKLKVGDWIRFGLCDDTICQITKFDAGGLPVIDDMSRVSGRINNAKLWIPEVGEWCWMSNNDENSPSLTLQKWYDGAKWTPQPFIGELPI